MRRASPLRPRSPPGPPPPRRDERDRWQGPIPAYINRRRSDEEPRRREAANKGKKKRSDSRGFSVSSRRGGAERVGTGTGVTDATQRHLKSNQRPSSSCWTSQGKGESSGKSWSQGLSKSERSFEKAGKESWRGTFREIKNISEVFAAGGEVAVGDLPLQEWKTGDRVVFTKAIYWEEKVRLAGVVKSLKVESGQVHHMSLKLEGTREESLVKWAGAHPGKLLEIHLCPLDCGQVVQGWVSPRHQSQEVEGDGEGRMDGQLLLET